MSLWKWRRDRFKLFVYLVSVLQPTCLSSASVGIRPWNNEAHRAARVKPHPFFCSAHIFTTLLIMRHYEYASARIMVLNLHSSLNRNEEEQYSLLSSYSQFRRLHGTVSRWSFLKFSGTNYSTRLELFSIIQYNQFIESQTMSFFLGT